MGKKVAKWDKFYYIKWVLKRGVHPHFYEFHNFLYFEKYFDSSCELSSAEMDKIFKIFIILFTNTFCIWQFYNRKNAIYFNIVKESDYAHSILRPVCALLFSGKAKASNEPFQTWMDGLTLDNTPLLLLKECVPLIFISIS